VPGSLDPARPDSPRFPAGPRLAPAAWITEGLAAKATAW